MPATARTCFRGVERELCSLAASMSSIDPRKAALQCPERDGARGLLPQMFGNMRLAQFTAQMLARQPSLFGCRRDRLCIARHDRVNAGRAGSPPGLAACGMGSDDAGNVFMPAPLRPAAARQRAPPRDARNWRWCGLPALPPSRPWPAIQDQSGPKAVRGGAFLRRCHARSSKSSAHDDAGRRMGLQRTGWARLTSAISSSKKYRWFWL